jgi:UDP-N-acetyl-D-glucosamine/UDP-N-acetyl-D-galactosamine dehydrogenase
LATPDIEKFGAKAIEDLDTGMQVDCIVINSPHDVFKQLAIQDLLGICSEKPVIIDVTGIYKEYEKMLDGHYFRI